MMQEFVADKQGSSGGLKEENEKLKKEIDQLKAKVEEAGKMVATSTEKQEDKEEEEEDEEDDELDEIPESFKKPEGQMSKMRTSVSAEAYGAWNVKKTDFEAPQYPKTEDQKTRLKATL